MNKEKYMQDDTTLHQLYGSSVPFKVPKGYFESLNSRLMAAIPTQENNVKKISLWKKWQTLTTVAAAVCCILFGAVVWINSSNNMTDDKLASNDNSYIHDSAIDEMVDYMMLDDDDIFSYIAEN